MQLDEVVRGGKSMVDANRAKAQQSKTAHCKTVK
jgi:hypothetical protein